MKPTIRFFFKDDYLMVSEWWNAHGFPPVPQAILPRLGVVAELDGSPIAAAWLYMDNSGGVSMMEWLVTNPGNRPKDSFRAISTIVNFLGEEAVANGYGVMLTTCKQPSLAKVFERTGFQKTDEGMIHLIRGLK